jgi:heme/copper-type cytochrome/quinol oxidase subunit 3
MKQRKGLLITGIAGTFFIILTLYAYRKQKKSNPEESCCTPKKV